MRPDLLELAGDLVKQGEPFALVIVVRREPPTSAQVGDSALVTEGGAFHGWLGGSCTQPTVVREARRVLADGVPRLIAISPDPETDHRPGVTHVPAKCASGGSVDIYIEPVLAPSRLLILGASATAQALARLGKAMGYTVDAADPMADSATFPQADRILTDLEAPELRTPPPHPNRFSIVVATMGQWDEQATSLAVTLEPSYLGVVASRKRFDQICETLGARGVPPDVLARIKNPAGLDIGAETPEEIALSILAEIVCLRRAALTKETAAEPSAPHLGPQPGKIPPLPPLSKGGEGGFLQPGGRGDLLEPDAVLKSDVNGVAVRPETSGAAEELDPVCGMSVDIDSAFQRAEVGGRVYYFCCGGCRERFVAAPERYTAGAMHGGAA